MSKQLSAKAAEYLLKIKQIKYLDTLEGIANKYSLWDLVYALSSRDLQGELEIEASTLLYKLNVREQIDIHEIVSSEDKDELTNDEKIVVCELLASECGNSSELVAAIFRALIELSTPPELINEIKSRIA